MARTIISSAQMAQWDYNANHPAFSERVVVNDDEMQFLVHIKKADIDLTKWWRTNDKRWSLTTCRTPLITLAETV